MRYTSVGVCRNVIALALVMLVAACSSVPGVESRLRDLSFSPHQHVTRAGDTLESLAWRYRLEPAELAALNPSLQGVLVLYPGMRVNVRPGPAPRAQDDRRRVADAQRYERRVEQQAVVVTPAPARARAPQPTYVPEQQAYAQAGSYARQDAYARQNVRNDQAVANQPRPRWRPEPLVPVEPYREERVQLQQQPAWPADTQRQAQEPLADPNRQPELHARADPDVWRREESWPREEVIPDDLDPLPAPTRASTDSRAAMDVQLARYVGRWAWPTDGAVARGFAPERAGGQGVDIAGVPGQDVRAALDGTVVYSGRDLSGGGNLVIVRHDDQLMTTYSHADSLFVAENDVVRAGDPIASLGWNAARESVLRFEVRREGSPLDPLDFLPAR